MRQRVAPDEEKAMFKILIVDDDDLNIEILDKLLGETYAVTSARSGEECLEKCAADRFGLVLLDIMMPGINGYETCKRIKASPGGENMQVILVSAKASTRERIRGYEAGADDYVVKPFDHDELLAKVAIHVRLRNALNELAEAHASLQGQNFDLERLVQKRTEEIVATRDVTVFALARLAESRDPETGHHLERMRSYAMILARQLQREGPYTHQITDNFLHDLFRSAPLHDIGKVGIPDVILLKPGRLTIREFELMQHHSTIGAQSLSEAAEHSRSGTFLKMAVEIAQSHHERFDGTGYPDGLAGLAIPLAARIVAVADVYDALTSARVYKAAFTQEVARLMIEGEEGKHFDPAIVAAFGACYEEFLQVATWNQPNPDELLAVAE
jgi:putative two-component system response regulator